VDSASVEVNRRARRTKTDRLDGDKLLAMLLRYAGGERRVWSVVRVPTLKEEDARRAHRELGRLGQERTAHVNRIRALLVLSNLRVKYVGGRLWQRWWTGHAQELAPCVRAEIERENARLLLVKKQMDTIGPFKSLIGPAHSINSSPRFFRTPGSRLFIASCNRSDFTSQGAILLVHVELRARGLLRRGSPRWASGARRSCQTASRAWN
jgi:hypothetical protein